MIPIVYPEPDFKTKKEGDKTLLFDAIRKTWLVLTEEEWVRQNFVAYLITTLHYPSSFIALEKGLMLGALKKRFDVLVYDRAHRPWMLVECKAPHIPLTEDVLQQVLRYNMSVPVPYLVLTNGGATYGWEKMENSLQPLTSLPPWPV